MLIYITFKKCSYYLYDAKATMKCDYTLLYKFLMAHTLNSKVNNYGTEIDSMSHITFELIKGIYNIIADSISQLWSIHLHDSLDM